MDRLPDTSIFKRSPSRMVRRKFCINEKKNQFWKFDVISWWCNGTFYSNNKIFYFIPIVTKTQKAGITFSVTRVHRHIRKGRYAKRIRIGAAVYAAVVLEYLVAEILELSGNEAAQNKKMRITPRHVMFAIRKDEELGDLLKNVTFSNSGVVPHVHPSLLNGTKKVKSQWMGMQRAI